MRGVITCAECNRPRCIFAKTAPGKREIAAIDSYASEVEYSCGAPLFSEDATGAEAKLADKFYIEENISCDDLVQKY